MLAPRRGCKSVPQIREKSEAREGEISKFHGEERSYSVGLRGSPEETRGQEVSVEYGRTSQEAHTDAGITNVANKAFNEICLKKIKSISLQSHEA